jgi:putative phosphoribosyl transferase
MMDPRESKILAGRVATGRTLVSTAQAEIETITLPVDDVGLAARWGVPTAAGGLVICVHESSDERPAARIRQLSGSLNEAGLATLHLDLLTADERTGTSSPVDVDLLARRLRSVTRWARGRFDWVGCLAGDLAAAAALEVAASANAGIAVVACFSGRPDLVESLGAVHAPTLLVVGSGDPAGIRRNQGALSRMTCPRQLAIIPGAGHLLDESATLATAAGHMTAWLWTYGARSTSRTAVAEGHYRHGSLAAAT